jgi:4-amino-4-deoxy-L-arabinose transferase-like glycosyltransferase
VVSDRYIRAAGEGATDMVTRRDPVGAVAPVPADTLAPESIRLSRRLLVWRSPADQPRWARPALLVIVALSTLAYAWGINNDLLEQFYGSAARSMSENWHNFFFGAVDPWGTVSVDKLPGALWFQALALRLFGFHIWVIVLPQVVEGALTILVLYRAVRRIAGAGAGLVAAIVMGASPIVILLDRGNISDSLLILLLVLAADAASRAFITGGLRPLLVMGLWVGLAFQTKMLQAWLVLPAFYLAYVLAVPTAALWRRLSSVALSVLVVVVVSLSWMTAVSSVPTHDRPYVDGSCNDSIFNQVFDYNGLARFGDSVLKQPGCHAPSQFLITTSMQAALSGVNTGAIGPGWDRLVTGLFGRDDAWVLPPAVVSLAGLLWWRRRRPRTDPVRASVVMWSTWLALSFGFFSAGRFINSYYVAELVPAIAALCGMGAAAAWHHRRTSPRLRAVVAATAVVTAVTADALVPTGAGVRGWIVAPTFAVAVGAAAILVASLRPRHASVWATTVGTALAMASMLLGSIWASGVVVAAGLGPFNAPYQTTEVDAYTQEWASVFRFDSLELNTFARSVPSAVAADVVESSSRAGFDILATGREFLPVGGYTGAVPAPPLPAFVQFVALGHVRRVTVATSPLSRSPDLLWARAHCRKNSSYQDLAANTTFSVYLCSPIDAHRS